MLDKEIEKLMDKRNQKLRSKQPKPAPAPARHDEVHEASDESFPASDPPAYTSAAPRKGVKYTRAPKEG